jgi:predicted DCC family thiol-disulfide oxidoreductase YuxK
MMTILYDDQCEFCTKISFWAVGQNPKIKAMGVRTIEAKELLKSHGIQYIDLQTVYFVSDKVSVRSVAAFNILRHTQAPWRWLSIFRFLPIALTDTIYKWVAKNRYRWN